MMSRKVLLTSLLLGLAQPVLAGGPDHFPEQSKFHPYVSAMGGGSIGSWEELKRVGAIGGHLDSRDNRLSGWEGYFAGGLTYDIVPRFSLSAEFGYGVSDSKFEFVSTFAGSNDFNKFRHYYTFGLLPAIQLNGQSLYAKLMATWGKLKFSTTVAAQEFSEFNETRSGGTLGLGVVSPVNGTHGYLAIRTEYDWSKFSQIKKRNGVNTETFVPNQDAFLMGLNVYFIPKDNDQPLVSLNQGVYVGLGGGRDLAELRRRQKTGGGIITHFDQGLGGAVARALFGYHIKLPFHMSLAPELTASYSSASYSESRIVNSANTYDYRLKDMYGIRGVVGVNTSDANEVFGLGGGVVTRFVKTGGEQLGNNFDRYKWGWQVGAGDQFAIMKCLSLRFEGDYARFQRIATGIADNGSNFSWRPTDERATVTAIYTFG